MADNQIIRGWNRFFAVPEKKRSFFQIILWWELRRIPYNLVIGFWGLLNLGLFMVFILHTDVLKPGEDAVEPIALMAAPILINICYTLGWITEIFLNGIGWNGSKKVGPLLLKAGLVLSLTVAMIPSVYWGVYWLVQLAGIISK